MQQFLAILVLGISAALHTSGIDRSIEAFIEREMPAAGVPGLAYAVVDGDEITAVGAHGVVTTGGDREVTPDTPFLTGSISKSFTALAVMQLVEADRIDLDTDISVYLEGFSGRPSGAATVRQLLSHTSGFSTLQGNTSHRDSTSGKDELARRVDGFARVNPAYGPDETWSYSNVNYQILGRLIEVVTGQQYQVYVDTNILDPVGMDDSSVADGTTQEAMATGHRPWFGAKRPLPDMATDRGTAPQGGIIASARDLARYMQMMMNGEDDVLSADFKALMMRPAGGASPFYGFGWFVDSRNDSVWHSGTSPGFETLATMIPAQRKGVVVLVNAGSGVGFGETAQLRNGLAATALGLDYGGEGSRLPQKALFIALILLPIGFLLSMIWAWRHRLQLRVKSGRYGPSSRSGPSSRFDLFSLWFPLLSTVVAAWVVLQLAPSLFGSPLGTIRLFQPDLGAVLIATAVTGVLWAVFRLAVAYTGRSGAQSGS